MGKDSTRSDTSASAPASRCERWSSRSCDCRAIRAPPVPVVQPDSARCLFAMPVRPSHCDTTADNDGCGQGNAGALPPRQQGRRTSRTRASARREEVHGAGTRRWSWKRWSRRTKRGGGNVRTRWPRRCRPAPAVDALNGGRRRRRRPQSAEPRHL